MAKFSSSLRTRSRSARSAGVSPRQRELEVTVTRTQWVHAVSADGRVSGERARNGCDLPRASYPCTEKVTHMILSATTYSPPLCLPCLPPFHFIIVLRIFHLLFLIFLTLPLAQHLLPLQEKVKGSRFALCSFPFPSDVFRPFRVMPVLFGVAVSPWVATANPPGRV